MSTKVKERLKKLRLEMNHEERMILDEGLTKLAVAAGFVVVKGELPCDAAIKKIDDESLKEIVAKIKKRKKRMLVEA